MAPSLEDWAGYAENLPKQETVDLSAISSVYEQAAGYLELGSLPPWLNKGGGKDKGKDSPSDMSDADLNKAVAALKEDDDSPKAKALRAEKAKRAKGGKGDGDADDKMPAFLKKD